ncbi:hypothetical protein DIURU_004410 [Diutina rugosa]|uniref:Anaphase-promoting complex subunit 4 WD40 domain-containing protein n=1 Tax=Diutina rugosa TaxID=5481 RepID=A0A642UHR0_DIURU|nr:uncharacterized protein DIURU_004410 [Diutina rugosa]KAA8899228.1 hypothetical protein DIURU_004410 [Diutina rugosa]
MAADHERTVAAPDAEEIELTRLVFGDTDGFHANLAKVDSLYHDAADADDGYSSDSDDASDDDDDEMLQDDDLFVIDDEGVAVNDDMEIDSDDDDTAGSDDAWNDSDDDEVTVSLTKSAKLKKLRKYEGDDVIRGHSYVHRLRAQFERIYPKPAWVDDWEKDNGDDNSSDQEVDATQSKSRDLAAVLASSVSYLQKGKTKLMSANHLGITRLKDANGARRAKGSIQAVDFHPKHPLLLTAGFDRTVRIYHIDGAQNPFVTSVFFKHTPIASCQFAPLADSTTIYAGGRRKYMNKWDVTSGEVEKISRLYGADAHQSSFEHFKVSPRGRFIGLKGDEGWCNLLNPSGQWARGLKVEGTVGDLAFTSDDSRVLIASTAGDMYEFALDQAAGAKGVNINQPVRKWHDDGVHVTCVSYGGTNDRWVAVGTQSGIVNIYDRVKLEAAVDSGSAPTPIKAVGNIVYPISTLEFSPDGQMLVIASRGKRDLLRIVHLPSARVFPNWPTSGTPLGKVTAVKFAPDNSMLAIANEQARVTLWRLTHY